MIHGALITESLRTKTTLDDLNICVQRIVRSQPQITTPDQPRRGTQTTSPRTETFVVFSGRTEARTPSPTNPST